MSICEFIFSLIKEENLSIKDLAEILNVSPSVLSNWKHRNTDPPAKYIIAIAKFLNISPIYLLTGEKETASQSDVKEGSSLPIFDQETQTIASLFQNLDEEGRSIVKATCYMETRRMTESKEKTPAPITHINHR